MFFAFIVKGAIKFFGCNAIFVALACLWAEAQEFSYEQRITNLDDKTQALEKRLDESENRSRRYNSFITDAKARLDAIRANRTPIEPLPEFPKLSPTVERTAPLPQPVPPPPPREASIVVPEEPRESKGYYLQVFGGYLIPESVKMITSNRIKAPIESKNGVSSGIVFGRDFGKFRLEGEVSGRKYSHKTIDLSSFGLSKDEPISGYSSTVGGLATAFYDIDLTKKLGVFIGIGTGVNGAKVKLEKQNFKDTLFAYQLLTGFVWDFAERVSTRFTYKYFTTAGSQDFDRLDSHNFELGVQIDL